MTSLNTGNKSSMKLVFNKLISSMSSNKKNNEPSSQESSDIFISFMREILDLIPSAFIGIDRNGVVIFWNKMAENIIGLDSKQAIGRNFESVLGLFSGYKNEIVNTLENRQASVVDKLNITVDDQEKFYSLEIFPVSNEHISIIVELNDISDKVNMEGVMLQSEKMATLGTLTAGMAHEFNNHLGGIIQSIKSIEKRFDPNVEKNKEIAEELEVSLNNMYKYTEKRGILRILQGTKDLSTKSAAIVHSVLNFSHRSDLVKELANINDMVDEIISMIVTNPEVKLQIKEDDLIFATELSPDLKQIYCMPAEVEQVLLNIIKNACQAVHEKKYKNNEKPKVTIKTTSTENSIKIEISDNGSGMSEKVKKHLYEAFFTTKLAGIGTGLGLSISHYIIVDRHQGSITVETEEGTGTLFCVELPID